MVIMASQKGQKGCESVRAHDIHPTSVTPRMLATVRHTLTSSSIRLAARRSSSHPRLLHTCLPVRMQIKPIPLRDDNYGYLIIDKGQPSKGVLVDPFDVPTCQKAAQQAGVTEIVANITTHHHQDHAGGNDAFVKAYPGAPVYGGSEQVARVSKIVGKGDSFPLFEGSSIQVKTYPTPCHTQDSVAFFLEDSKQVQRQGNEEYKRAVFTGDTLFISGCGRFFEGTPEEMHQALNVTLAALPGDTVVMCGHEYTKANVAFSQGVLPDRPAIKALVDFVRQGKNGGVTTGVFTIDDEKKHNVFMLVDDPEVKQSIGMPNRGAVEVMAALRELKNSGKMMSKV